MQPVRPNDSVHRLVKDPLIVRFLNPFFFFVLSAVRVPRQSTYRSLQLSIIKAQHSSIRDQTIDYAQDYVVFQMTLVDQYQTTLPKPECSIVHDVQWPLYFNKIDEILDTYVGQELGPSHIQIYANWHEKYLVEFLSKWSTNDDKPDIHQSVAQARATLLHQPTSSLISLADCFSLFTQTECLNYVNSLTSFRLIIRSILFLG